MEKYNYLQEELLETDTDNCSTNLVHSLENLNFHIKLVDHCLTKMNNSTNKLKESIELLDSLVG